jgi:hypothetical protein
MIENCESLAENLNHFGSSKLTFENPSGSQEWKGDDTEQIGELPLKLGILSPQPKSCSKDVVHRIGATIYEEVQRCCERYQKTADQGTFDLGQGQMYHLMIILFY